MSNARRLLSRFRLKQVARRWVWLTVFVVVSLTTVGSAQTAFDTGGRDPRAWLEAAGKELRVRADDAGAQYPLTIDSYIQGLKLTTAIPCSYGGTCDEGEAYNAFGTSVAMSADGSTLVVGVPTKVTNGVVTGAAYVFVKPPDQLGGWAPSSPLYFAAKLLPSDGFALMGKSVAISRDGGTIVAGAPESGGVGTAYVFVKPANGWGSVAVQTQNARLRAWTVTNHDNHNSFGDAVTISGDGGTIVVGAPRQQDTELPGTDRGAAYVFFRSASGWLDSSESQRIPGAENSLFGRSQALSDDGTTLAVGAVGSNGLTGYVDILHRPVGQTSTWFTFQARLRASGADPYDLFGYSVAANGDGSAVVVGAPSNDGAGRAGAAFVFERPSAGWGPPDSVLAETAKLTASDSQVGDSFGVSVALSQNGSTLLAGASQGPFLFGTYNGPGAVYIFGKPEAGWTTATETAKVIQSDGLIYDMFGSSTSVNGNGTALVAGAPAAMIGDRPNQGAAYVFAGSVATPFASVAPSGLMFGPQSVGTASSPQTVTLTNTGTAPLYVTNVGATGAFTATQNCVSASPIAAGGSCSESVAFAPVSAGPATGTLTFTDNSGGTPGTVQTVQLQGDGEKGNTSTTIVSVSNQVFVGDEMLVYFSVAPESGGSLSPSGTVTVESGTGESCTSGAVSGVCSLTFSTVGDRTITATYNGNVDFNPSTSASVLVKVVDFGLSASPSSLIAGRKTTYRLTVDAVNGFTGTVLLGCSGGPVNTTCTVSPASVTLSGQTTKAKAALALPANADAGTYTITFTGTYGNVTRSTTATLTVK